MMFVDCLLEYPFYSKDKYEEMESNISDMLSAFFAMGGSPLSSGDMSSVLGIIGTALLTVLIPITVVVFKGRKGDYETLDLNVILDHVVGGRFFLLYLSFIYVPVFLLGIFSFSSLFSHGLFLGVWFWGVCGMVEILIKSYLWMKGGEDELRKKYLRKLNASNELGYSLKLWRSVWEAESRHYHHEREFFMLFSSTIDNLKQGRDKDIEAAYGLMMIFNAFIYKRSTNFLSFRGISKILEWHFFIWKKTYEQKRGSDAFLYYSDLLRELFVSLKKIRERTLREGKYPEFFDCFMPHVEKHKIEFVGVEAGRIYYAQNIMHDFFEVLTEGFEKDDNDATIVPSVWGIKSKNIRNPESLIPRLLFNNFVRWADRRIYKLTEYDRALSNALYKLFPNACPTMWPRILNFLMQHDGDEKHMESLIKHPMHFNGMGWAGSILGDDEETKKKQRIDRENDAIDLALFRFGGNLTENILNGYITELKALEDKNYPADSPEEERREEYIRIFKLINKRREE